MASCCKGICLNYKHTSLPNGIKYTSGLKRCTECQVFMNVECVRCPCCKLKLRTKPRNKKY